MMEDGTLHKLILRQWYADPVLNGDKLFEVRCNDRGFQKGDKLKFTVVDEIGLTVAHPLNREYFVITYVLSGYGIEADYVVFGFKKIDEKEKENRNESNT